MLQVINAFPPYFFISSFLLPNLQKKVSSVSPILFLIFLVSIRMFASSVYEIRTLSSFFT